MARIDALYLEDPSSGSRRIVDYPVREGIPISRDRVPNLMRRKGLREIYQKPPSKIHRRTVGALSPPQVVLKVITAVDMSEPRISPTSRCRKASYTWPRSWICFLGTCSAGSCQTALTANSVSMTWRWHWKVKASQRFSTQPRVVNSHQLTLWPDCRETRSSSAGQAGSAAMTTSWWIGCGE